MKQTERNRLILSSFAAAESLTARELSKLLPHFANLRESCNELALKGLLRHGPEQVREPKFSITYKGRQHIGKGKRPEPLGEAAEPCRRDWRVAETYTGSTFVPPRAGSMRAYEIPSLGDTERRRPMLIGSNPDPRYRVLP